MKYDVIIHWGDREEFEEETGGVQGSSEERRHEERNCGPCMGTTTQSELG